MHQNSLFFFPITPGIVCYGNSDEFHVFRLSSHRSRRALLTSPRTRERVMNPHPDRLCTAFDRLLSARSYITEFTEVLS
jgi:hypothetical protein